MSKTRTPFRKPGDLLAGASALLLYLTYILPALAERRQGQARAGEDAGSGAGLLPHLRRGALQKGELEVTNHLQDFLDSIRTGQRPRCDVDRAFEEAAAVAMSVEAYRRERKVR